MAGANAFVQALHDELRSDPRQPLQQKAFFGSATTLQPTLLGPTQTARIFSALGLDSATLGAGNSYLRILRDTLVNPYLVERDHGISYIDLYFEILTRRVRDLSMPA